MSTPTTGTPAIEAKAIEHTRFWANAVQKDEELTYLVAAVNGGNLLGMASQAKLSISLDAFSGVADIPISTKGAINMKGDIIPPLPRNGKFRVEIGATTIVLYILDNASLPLYIWEGTGSASPTVRRNYEGTWVRKEFS
ncbi:hypothetical protein EUX98_g5542 [Antrodiella citrinella]|uniref:Uncharacterized protein n=1 Tax=Antrodiella citrinella TaxID=2447956 RepID=A0A4V3XIC1_9APHY|nr:hypothetical protein EUX98_g5542 [Antrodiella citrinella]